MLPSFQNIPIRHSFVISRVFRGIYQRGKNFSNTFSSSGFPK